MATTELGPALLHVARRALAGAFDRGIAAAPRHAMLEEEGATFVTLRQHGDLRGCIGTLEAHRPLWHDVEDNTLSAAFRDPRFAPLAARELDITAIEVSLLSAPRPLPIAGEDDLLAQLRPGVDGVVLAWRGRRATFLPQVWDTLARAARLHRRAEGQGRARDRLLGRRYSRVALHRRQVQGTGSGSSGLPIMSDYRGRYWHLLDDGRMQCDLCPRDCRLHEGQRGACFVRQRVGDEMILTTYGRSSGFCIDPIEKKPLNHFYPGSSVLSFGTAGCNLACKFCQNWDISKSREMDTLMDAASPEAIARLARARGSKSVAYTYNDPVIFAEYAMDAADACREAGIKSVAVTAGYMHAAPRRDFYAKMDAANVDLKAFTDAFYVKQTGAHLQPVLDTLVYLKHETDVWFEITTLLIPGMNDSSAEIEAMSKWIVRELGRDVPLHFTAFHPDYKLTDVPPTPPATLRRARDIALAEGITLRLHRQRPRHRRRHDPLPRVRSGA